MLIGDKIRAFRTEQNISQQELANQLFVTYQEISEWEANHITPSTEIVFSIIKRFSLPLNYFTTLEEKSYIDKLIFQGFFESIRVSYLKKPSLEEVARASGVSKILIKTNFLSYENLLYNFLNSIDEPIYQDIHNEIKSKNSREIIIDIYINKMLPYVYERNETFKVLYTRHYIAPVWKEFIKIRYTRVMHHLFQDSDELKAEYVSEMLIGLISVWITQENIEPLETLQKRTKKNLLENLT